MNRDDSRSLQVKNIICIQLVALALLTVLICFIGPYTGIIFNIDILDLHEYYTFPMIRIRDIMSQGIDMKGLVLNMSDTEGEWALTAAMVFGGIIPVILLIIRALLGIYTYVMKEYKRWFACLPAVALSLTVIVTVIVRAQFKNALEQSMSELGEEVDGLMGAFGGTGSLLAGKIEDCISVPLCWGFFTVCILCTILLLEDLLLLPRFFGEGKEGPLSDYKSKLSFPFIGEPGDRSDSPGRDSYSSPYSDLEIGEVPPSKDFSENEGWPEQNEGWPEQNEGWPEQNEDMPEQNGIWLERNEGESWPGQNEDRPEQNEGESWPGQNEDRPERNEGESWPEQNGIWLERNEGESWPGQNEDRPERNEGESWPGQNEDRPEQKEDRPGLDESRNDQNESFAADEKIRQDYHPGQVPESGQERRHGIIWVKGEHVGQINYFEGSQPINIGRSQTENQVVLSEISVSRRHCSLYYLEEHDGYVIEDTSYNGVYIAGNRLEKGKKYLVKPGTTISLGARDSFRLL